MRRKLVPTLFASLALAGLPLFTHAAGLNVGAITPSSATVNVAQSYGATYSDDLYPVSSCSLFVNGSNNGAMSLTGSMSGTATRSVTFTSAGTNSLFARCTDSFGVVTTGATTTVTVAASTQPSVGSVSPTSATVNAASTLSASYSGSVAVSSCTLFVDGSSQGSMSLSGSLSGTASKSFTFSSTGSHTAFVRCTDNAGVVTTGATTTINVAASGSGDVTLPTQPTSLQVTTSASDSTPTFVWSSSSDNVAVTGYQVQIDGSAFAPIGNTTTYTASAIANGSHTIGVRAIDAAGNVSATTTLAFSISGSVVPPATPPSLQPPFQLDQMSADATLVAGGANRTTLEAQTGRTCEFDAATAAARVQAVFGNSFMDANMRTAIENFVGCGTVSTRWLGAGERIGIVNSYRAAFGRLPATAAHWNDVMKIGNGRFTSETSASAEAAAQVTFRKIYLRDAVMANEHDRNAVTIMAYGLRPLPRSLSAEASAIVTFKAVYGHNPVTASEWDAVRATAYSGATR
jgi:hypothetical protein